MVWLGIDLGDARVGLALSDPGITLAHPAGNIQVYGDSFRALDEVVDVIEDESVDHVGPILQHGSALSKQRLLDVIYGMDEEASEDALEIYIHRLRKKLEASDASIMTLRGVGYLLKPRLAPDQA